jgi:hypothetical protein
MTPLRKRMIDEMMLRGFCTRTRKAYVGAVKGLARPGVASPVRAKRLVRREVQPFLLGTRVRQSGQQRLYGDPALGMKGMDHRLAPKAHLLIQ